MNKRTLVIGASLNPNRYSHLAILSLQKRHYDICAIGKSAGSILGTMIDTHPIDYPLIDTVTLYLNPSRQSEYYSYIISLNPQRVIFNPGSENLEFEVLLTANHIQFLRACTLVLLSTGQY